MKDFNIYQKLHAVSSALESLHKVKPKDVNYKVVSSSMAIEPIKKAIDDSRLFLECEIESITESNYSQKTKFGERLMYLTEISLIYTFVNIDKPDEKIQKKWIGRFAMDSPGTSYGATLTYTEKYFLLKFFNVPTDEDDPDLKPQEVEEIKSKSVKSTPQEKPKELTNISESLPVWLVEGFRKCKTIDEINEKDKALSKDNKYEKLLNSAVYKDLYNSECERVRG